MESNMTATHHSSNETIGDLDPLLSDEALFEVEVIDLDKLAIVKCLCRLS